MDMKNGSHPGVPTAASNAAAAAMLKSEMIPPYHHHLSQAATGHHPQSASGTTMDFSHLESAGVPPGSAMMPTLAEHHHHMAMAAGIPQFAHQYTHPMATSTALAATAHHHHSASLAATAAAAISARQTAAAAAAAVASASVAAVAEPDTDPRKSCDLESPTVADFRISGELEAFAEHFKQRRIKLGVTQADVGKALANLKLPGVGSLSQSTICRFESLTLSHNNMIALKPILSAWLEQAENVAKGKAGGGGSTSDKDPGGHLSGILPNSDKKRKRTSIAAPEKRSLEAYFAVQPRPSGEKIAAIAEKLDLKKNVVRVWFCNQRQKQKR